MHIHTTAHLYVMHIHINYAVIPKTCMYIFLFLFKRDDSYKD